MKRDSHPLSKFVGDSLSEVAMAVFTDWLEREPLVADLTVANRNRCLLALVDAGEPITRLYSAQRGLKQIWVAAHQAGLIDHPGPGRMFHRTFDPRPNAPWTADEYARMLQAVHSYPYRTPYLNNGIKRAAFWECFVRLTQETRLFRVFVQGITWNQFDPQARRCDLTGHPLVGLAFKLSRPTVDAIEAIRYPERETVLPFHSSHLNVFNATFCKLLNHAGVEHRPGYQPRGKARKPMRRRAVQ